MKLKVKPCTKCKRDTLQYRERHQMVHVPGGDAIDSADPFDCWVCTCCGTMTTDRMLHVTQVVKPGYPPDNPGDPTEVH